MWRSLVMVSATLLGLAGPLAGVAAPRYTVLDLGRGVTGTDLNASGQVVGALDTDLGWRRAFITGADGQGMTVLGTLGGTTSYAMAVNDSGWVAGWSLTDPDSRTSPRHAFVTGAGGQGLRDLGSLGGLDPYGHDDGYATDITADGRVAGFGYAPPYEPRIFVTGPGGHGMTAFSVDHHGTYGAAINERGQIAGTYNDGGEYFAFVTGPGGAGVHVLAPSTLLLQPLVEAVDPQGRVVGGYWYPDGVWPRAFLTGPDGSDMTELGTLGGLSSTAYDLNGDLVVVGEAYTARNARHAFITAPGGGAMQDLNDLVALDGVELASAVAINERGQVLVNSDNGHAYLLTPVPEPATWLLGLAGGALLLTRRRAGARAQDAG